MSVRPRIRVLRLRQLSTSRLYERIALSTSRRAQRGRRPVDGEVRRQAPRAPGQQPADRSASPPRWRYPAAASSRRPRTTSATRAGPRDARRARRPRRRTRPLDPPSASQSAALRARLRRGPLVVHGRIVESAAHGGTRARSTGAECARTRHRDALRTRLHALRRGDPPLCLHPAVPQRRSTTSPASSRRSGSASPRTRSARSSRATGPPVSRSSGSARTATRTERRPLRRHDGRRHRARGVPAERRARPRPAAAADLVPRGGRLGLRADAARQPDHAAARHRGGAARDFRAIDDGAASGSTPRRPGTSRRAGASAIHVLDDLVGWIEMHIEQARVLQDTGQRIGVVNAIAGYVHADVVVQARRPCRRDADGPAPRSDARARRDGARARAARAGGRAGHSRHDRRDRGRPGADQRDRELRALLARHPRPGGRAPIAVSPTRSRRSPSPPRSGAGCAPRCAGARPSR